MSPEMVPISSATWNALEHGKAERAASEAIERAEAAEAALVRVQALGEAWVGFDDSHHYGDALLKAVAGRVGA